MKIRVEAVSDREEAEFIAERNRQRGYTCTIDEFEIMRWDGSDLGGSVDILQDVDSAAFLVISRK